MAFGLEGDITCGFRVPLVSFDVGTEHRQHFGGSPCLVLLAGPGNQRKNEEVGVASVWRARNSSLKNFVRP